MEWHANELKQKEDHGDGFMSIDEEVEGILEDEDLIKQKKGHIPLP